MARDSQNPRDTHSIHSSKESLSMRVRADYLEWDARSLGGMGIQGMESQANARKAKAAHLRKNAQEGEALSDIENTKVRAADHWKITSEGRKNYPLWVCSWRKGNKTVTKYIGSCSRMGQQEALGAGDFKDEI